MNKKFWLVLGLLLLLSGCNQTTQSPTVTTANPPSTQSPTSPKPTPEHYEQQRAMIRRRSRPAYRVKKLLNKPEKEVFWELVKITREYNHRVFPQVSLGEVFTSDDRNLYMSVNSKRSDFCVTDKQFEPIALVEYHGSGHFKGTAKSRDGVKEEAALAAGIRYVAIYAGEEKRSGEILAQACGWLDQEDRDSKPPLEPGAKQVSERSETSVEECRG